MRYFITYTLILALLLSIGCYPSTVVKPEHVSQGQKIEAVVLTNNTRIDFDDDGGKFIQIDTLKMIAGTNKLTGQQDSIDLRTIRFVAVRESDWKLLPLPIALALGIGVVVLLIVFVNTFEDSFML